MGKKKDEAWAKAANAADSEGGCLLLIAFFLIGGVLLDNPTVWPWLLAGFGIVTVGRLGRQILNQRHALKMAEIEAIGKQQVLDYKIITEESQTLAAKIDALPKEKP